MADVVELHGVDALRAGAVGPPGARAFLIEAAKDDQRLSVLVEKEQVAMLAAEATQFLDKIAEDYPEGGDLVDPGDALLRDPPDPLFRARLIGLGFDPESRMVLVELREEAEAETDEDDGEAVPAEPDTADGWIARFFATRSQVRAMAWNGQEAVQAGRERWN